MGDKGDIKLKSIFDENEDIKTVIFGNGDVVVTTGFVDSLEEEIGCVSFYKQNPNKIGEVPEIFKKGSCVTFNDDLNIELQFFFEKIESIDVVISILEKTKIQMLESEKHK